ncbi:hypothetical protein Sru01_04240 [Sphaerisporangium rufum]|uniref:DUF5941 domain-containing protein n=1 Tax=Sphaerisporangium rufum TaxID=1381558 RepID=A0A919R1X3_9ACTN|nr:DUF5941 domain-containing protein [Sphaerisporangium rufum]GII75442.1 hypothetical protein Sru01_04240 [Sphaerisporangium rufum]
MTPTHPAPAPRGALLTYRDDGVLARGAGLLVAGQLPPLPPALAGAFVTGVMLFLGIAGAQGPAVFAPAVALLLAGPGSSHQHDGRLDWLVPPLLRLTEYGFVAAVGFAWSVPTPLVFVVLGATIFHHYDVVHRCRQGFPPPGWLASAGLGWEGRMLLAALAALLGAATTGYALLAVYLTALFCWESVTCWLAVPRTGVETADLAAEE